MKTPCRSWCFGDCRFPTPRAGVRCCWTPALGEQVPAATSEGGAGATSALRVLRSLAGLLQAVLLALDGAGVTGEEAGALESRAILGGDLDQGAGDGQTQCACLAGRAATVQERGDVEGLGPLDGDQRSLDQLLVHLVREVV